MLVVDEIVSQIQYVSYACEAWLRLQKMYEDVNQTMVLLLHPKNKLLSWGIKELKDGKGGGREPFCPKSCNMVHMERNKKNFEDR